MIQQPNGPELLSGWDKKQFWNITVEHIRPRIEDYDSSYLEGEVREYALILFQEFEDLLDQLETNFIERNILADDQTEQIEQFKEIRTNILINLIRLYRKFTKFLEALRLKGDASLADRLKSDMSLYLGVFHPREGLVLERELKQDYRFNDPVLITPKILGEELRRSVFDSYEKAQQEIPDNQMLKLPMTKAHLQKLQRRIRGSVMRFSWAGSWQSLQYMEIALEIIMRSANIQDINATFEMSFSAEAFRASIEQEDSDYGKYGQGIIDNAMSDLKDMLLRYSAEA